MPPLTNQSPTSTTGFDMTTAARTMTMTEKATTSESATTVNEGITLGAGSDSQRRTVIIVSVVVASSVMAVLSVAIV